MRIRDLFDPGSGIRDPEFGIRDPVSGIRNKHPGSATLLLTVPMDLKVLKTYY